MKKLYINVNRCELYGGAEALSPLVKEIDIRMQELAQETEIIKGVLFKFVGDNSSEQFERAAVEVYNLSERLYDSSEQLNEMQCQIVKYQEAIAKFNDNNYSFSAPNAHNVQKVQISTDVNHFQFTYEEMVYVDNSIQNYVNNARDSIVRLKSNKDEIGSIWRDPQYNDFSDFIDETVSVTEKGIVVLEEYSAYLSKHIIELNNQGGV